MINENMLSYFLKLIKLNILALMIESLIFYPLALSLEFLLDLKKIISMRLIKKLNITKMKLNFFEKKLKK